MQALLARVAPHVRKDRGPRVVVDPSCGAGAFLAEAARVFPDAQLFGLELDAEVARHCRERVPRAQILEGDALRGGLEALTSVLPEGFELWIGNPPYNGTSAVLRDPAAYRRLRALLPEGALPRGTSLRDDYAFFLLLCAERLRGRAGAMALVTSATLLDAFLYSPLRRHLLQSLTLTDVLELGEGVFEDTKVRTCATVFVSPPGERGATRYQRRKEGAAFGFEAPVDLTPQAPELIFRPAQADALALDARWREEGELLTTLVPVSFPGLKTRFDELLVDDSPSALLRRLEAFAAAPKRRLAAFARAHDIPDRAFAKLAALKDATPGLKIDPARVRPFYRYAGAKHRGEVPESARAFCYLDRALIPRGDHRLRGDYNPHLGDVKLIFNVRELPLSAALLRQEGCVHDHRHARFAPLFVPEAILREGPAAARRGAGSLGPGVVNLSERGRELARRKGGPAAAFAAIAAFINSAEVQRGWAPDFGASRVLPVPVEAL